VHICLQRYLFLRKKKKKNKNILKKSAKFAKLNRQIVAERDGEGWFD